MSLQECWTTWWRRFGRGGRIRRWTCRSSLRVNACISPPGLTVIAAIVGVGARAKAAHLRRRSAKPAVPFVGRARDARVAVVRRERLPIRAVCEILVELKLPRPVGGIRTWAKGRAVDNGHFRRRVLQAGLLTDHLLRGGGRGAVVVGKTLRRPLLVDPHGAEDGALVPDRGGAGIGAPELVGEFGGAELERVGKVVQGGGVKRPDVGDFGEEGEGVGEVAGG